VSARRAGTTGDREANGTRRDGMATTNTSIPPDTNNAIQYLVVCGVFALIAMVLVVMRVSTRTKPVIRLKVDDYLIILAEVG
jgi:hypothetical protein